MVTIYQVKYKIPKKYSSRHHSDCITVIDLHPVQTIPHHSHSDTDKWVGEIIWCLEGNNLAVVIRQQQYTLAKLSSLVSIKVFNKYI